MELLQLRRDRVVRADSVIDKNQALILSAPNLLPRLMELLRVMNFNPPLALFGEKDSALSCLAGMAGLTCFGGFNLFGLFSLSGLFGAFGGVVCMAHTK